MLKTYAQDELNEILKRHRMWLNGALGGVYADLSYSDLSYSDLRGSNLRGSNLSYSNLRGSNLRGSNLRGSNLRGSNLSYSNLRGSNLRGSDLSYSDLSGSDLSGSNLSGSDLSGSDLRAYGNMRELRTLQIGTWGVGYTHDTLQIGCQRHSIEKWRKWDTPAGRRWIAGIDVEALEWADRNLTLVLALIDANPATK